MRGRSARLSNRTDSRASTGVRGVLRTLGPGVLTGAADDDPSGITTYTIAGATQQYALLWLLLLTVPMLFVVEEMSARVGTVAGEGLQSLIVEKFGRVAAVACAIVLVICNISTITADIAGIGAGFQLITGLDWRWFVVPIGAGIVTLLVAQNYRRVSRILLWLTPLFFMYVVAGFLARPAWGEVLVATFVPRISASASFLFAAVALLGTTISPYLIYWQTTEDVEERTPVRDLMRRRVDIAVGMLFSNFIAFFIIVTAGTVLYPHPNLRSVQSAAQAAAALAPVAGKLAFALFSLGLVVTGLLAVPVLAASTSYVVLETLRCCRMGLDRDIKHAPKFYYVIIAAVALAVAAAFIGLSPIQMLFYSQVLQGLLMPVLLYFLIRIADDTALMGEYTNPRWIRRGGWLTAIFMGAFALATAYQAVLGGG